MNRKRGLIPKILDKKKTIESRWSKNKIAPWKKVKIGDTVYFKNSGEAVVARARVGRVKQFENLNLSKIKEILKEYGGDGKISVGNVRKTLEWIKNKNYCTLVYLRNPVKVKPFTINKTGFGSGCAWLSVEDVKEIALGN